MQAARAARPPAAPLARGTGADADETAAPMPGVNAADAPDGPDFSTEGPHAGDLVRASTRLCLRMGGDNVRIAVQADAPRTGKVGTGKAGAGAQLGAAAGAAPLLVLFNGFQAPMAYYDFYAARVASWGFCVVRYDLPGFLLKKVVRDDVEEVAVLPALVDWVQEQTQTPSSALYGAVDVSTLAVAGHSRGAKLAALAFAAASLDCNCDEFAGAAVDHADANAGAGAAAHATTCADAADNPVAGAGASACRTAADVADGAPAVSGVCSNRPGSGPNASGDSRPGGGDAGTQGGGGSNAGARAADGDGDGGSTRASAEARRGKMWDLSAALRGGGLTVRAAVLVDPVDLTPYTRKQGYPSAVEALTGLGCRAAVVGAGITGSCNPKDEGYAAFWRVLTGRGGWLATLPHVGHMQLTGASGPWGWALDRLCGAGRGSHQEAMQLASTVMVAWLRRELWPGPDTDAGCARFEQWAEEQRVAGHLTLEKRA